LKSFERHRRRRPPGDIEFYMAGTLLLLKAAGWERTTSIFQRQLWERGAQTRGHPAIRRREAQRAARILGAAITPAWRTTWRFSTRIKALRRLAAILSRRPPSIVLTHSPRYMEDHTTRCRLKDHGRVLARMANFQTIRPARPSPATWRFYHAMPHGLCDGLRRRLIPGAFVNTTSVQARKREALAAHASQKAWLDASQEWTRISGR